MEKTISLEELCEFICNLNTIESHSIGYCGDNLIDIKNSLMNEFEAPYTWDKSFFLKKDESGIKTVIGLNIDEKEKVAEVWGPYSKDINEDWEKQYKELWKLIVIKYKNMIEQYCFFCNVKNIRAQAFIKSIGAQETGKHVVLELKKVNLSSITRQTDPNISPIKFEDYSEFKELHDELFANSYYTGEEIIRLINSDDQYKLFTYTDNDVFSGYLLCRVDEFELYIEYIGVKDAFRRQGIGSKLVEYIQFKLFEYTYINSILVCINSNNYNSKRIFERSGFCLKEYNISYVLKND
ncbi:GNAT family N-acetyltransferase [Paenibacillus hunanensis]|uniref:Ribosomal protein S18 acetylase RimI-like enzyme n=1 Tax=Paenibacillus hunanensis TaxID=539262 RepID=A0ABU1J2F0_9BACL|nr:GNAT family N-acetyltransferase [Paenibacillus hunanensis]MDR6245599.1 ribosomal protein S18 acetylase RimI-like enzyme [Paenibacillus hunanensis]GGJ28765.1 N-acetyltransferase [Paenibacillus hunanensis]